MQVLAVVSSVNKTLSLFQAYQILPFPPLRKSRGGVSKTSEEEEGQKGHMSASPAYGRENDICNLWVVQDFILPE